MPYFLFHWTKEIVDHLAENDVMTEEELSRFLHAIAEEQAGKAYNIAEARELLPAVVDQCEQAVEMIQLLKAAREKAGVSLSDMETRTGILKSALSRLENARAPNPTLSYLQRYAQAIGYRIVLSLQDEKTKEHAR